MPRYSVARWVSLMASLDTVMDMVGDKDPYGWQGSVVPATRRPSFNAEIVDGREISLTAAEL